MPDPIATSRYNRIAQQRHRAGRRSYKTELEDALVLVAWEAAELSEGQVAKILGCSRIEARDKRIAAIRQGRLIADALLPKPAERNENA